MKGLDHIVLAVNDLDQAANIYRGLGFTVTPLAKHPFGTHNCIVQLDGFFLEILTVAEPEKIPPETVGNFGFAHFNQRYLAKHQGPSMLVMDTTDFRADNVDAKSHDLQTYETFEFSRNAVLPSKEVVEVSFGLNFVTHPQMPMAAFFTCQQFQPEYFWKSEYQLHKNSARQILEVCLVADQPSDYAEFMSAYAHCEISVSDRNKVVIETARGRILITTPKLFEQRYQTTAPNLTDGPLIAGLTIGVENNPPEAVSVCETAILFESLT